MGPRNFCTLAMVLLFITIGALGSPSTNHTDGVSIARFFRKGTPVRSVDGLPNRAESYARELTRRKPTRRGTAQRRAPSDLPPVPFTMSVVAMAAGELPVGNLVFTTMWGLTDISQPGSLITYIASPSWTSRDQQSLTYVAAGNPGLWPLFGASQCSFEEGMDLRPGSSDTVCLANIDNPGTLPGSLPVVIPNSIGTTTAVETHIWTIDYVTGQATPQWINADGTSFACIMVYDPISGGILITADLEATSTRLQRALMPISLRFSAAPV